MSRTIQKMQYNGRSPREINELFTKYMIQKGYVDSIVNNERVFSKGQGFDEPIQCFRIIFQKNCYVIEVWITDIFKMESDLKGFVGRIVKEDSQKTLNEFVKIISFILPEQSQCANTIGVDARTNEISDEEIPSSDMIEQDNPVEQHSKEPQIEEQPIEAQRETVAQSEEYHRIEDEKQTKDDEIGYNILSFRTICVGLVAIVVIGLFFGWIGKRKNVEINTVTKEKLKTQAAAIQDLHIGDIIEYGFYEQDNNTMNGKEPIKWEVMSVDGTQIALLCRYCLDAMPYNTTRTYVTWETCSLRNWLNSTFKEEAFGKDTNTILVKTEVIARENPYYDSNPGDDTMDYVYLPSTQIIENSWKPKKLFWCDGTKYLLSKGVKVSDYISRDQYELSELSYEEYNDSKRLMSLSWNKVILPDCYTGIVALSWLRNSGRTNEMAATFSVVDYIANGCYVDDELPVRPMITIDLALR